MNLLVGHLGAKSESIEPATLLADLALDSLDTVELVMNLEDEFGRDIPESEIVPIETVADLVEFVRRLQ
ncbi:MAG TPA: phosphopantetheine-binding protein [Fimbriimonadaceae bacterium]|nr:phosphopantetheine-binding protein [Fimbriimonadaceae bacterium]